MAGPESILSVDIGGDSLKIAEFLYPPDGGIILQKFAFVEYGGDLQEEELLDSLENSYRDAVNENGFTARTVHLSISGQSAFTRFVKLPPVGEEEGRVRQIVEYEARQNVPFPMEEVVWDYQLISTGDDEESEIEVMFVVVKNEMIERISQVVEENGQQVEVVEIAPTACYNAARANEVGEDGCHMILNIGGRCSSLVFIDNGRFFVRTIPIAGHTVTQQIAKEFGIPFADAEEMKRRHGFVALGGAYEEPDSEVAATVSKIVRNVMTRLHGEVNRSINVYRAQQQGQKPTKLFLAGGSSVMAFTPRFFSEKLRIPVEYFNPFQVVSLSLNIDKEDLAEVAHMFSEVIGLGLRRATVCPIEISLVPEKLRQQHEIRQKTPYFICSCLSLIVCISIIYGAMYIQQSRLETLLELANKEVARTERLEREVQAAKAKYDSIDRRFKNTRSILGRRGQWVALYNELQAIIPDRMWFVSIKGTETRTNIAGDVPEKKDRRHHSLFESSAFGNPRGRGGPEKATTSTKFEWVVVEGHTLRGPLSPELKEKFKDAVIRSPLFTDNRDEIQTVSSIPYTARNNITSFTMEIKLKNPINPE